MNIYLGGGGVSVLFMFFPYFSIEKLLHIEKSIQNTVISLRVADESKTS